MLVLQRQRKPIDNTAERGGRRYMGGESRGSEKGKYCHIWLHVFVLICLSIGNCLTPCVCWRKCCCVVFSVCVCTQQTTRQSVPAQHSVSVTSTHTTPYILTSFYVLYTAPHKHTALSVCMYNTHNTCTVEPPNKGHFGANSYVPCKEVVPISEVK